MPIKRFLVYFPLVLTAVLVQSFFWVPSYENQATGNPARLARFVQSSIGDAQILNPILHADSASGEIVDKIFDGLIDLDTDLNYRPRLATGWRQYEEAWLALDPDFVFQGRKLSEVEDWSAWLKNAFPNDARWLLNIRSVEAATSEAFDSVLEVATPTGGQPQEAAVRVYPYLRLKFVLDEIDQDFFGPFHKQFGEGYFEKFPWGKFVRAKNPKEQNLFFQKSHSKRNRKILAVEEHNPVIEFDLRRGVLFHDGHEFDSGDALFTYQAIMNPKNASPRTSDYEPIKSFEILGPYKVKITYKELFSSALNSWAMGILPEHLLNDEVLAREAKAKNSDPKNFSMRDSEFNRHPVGTGSFIFNEWLADQIIKLKRNDRYWDSLPEYEEFVVRIIPDTLVQEMEFYAGSVDNYPVQPHQVDRLKNDDKFQSFSSVGYMYNYIGYNLRKPLFADPGVRRALGMAIDAEKIIRYVMYDEGERVTGPYPKITDWYDPSVQPLPYDPAGALKILNELGWEKNRDGYLEKDGKVFEFNLITNNGNPIRKNILSIAQSGWEKIGIKCNTQLFEWAVFLKDFVNANKFDALVLGWSMGNDPDLYQIWHSSQTEPRQLNFVGYKNAEVDRLILRVRREYNKNEQIKLARQIHRIIARDQPYTFLFVPKSTRLLDKKIVMVERGLSGEESYEKIYPTRDGKIEFYFNRWKKLPSRPEFSS